MFCNLFHNKQTNVNAERDKIQNTKATVVFELQYESTATSVWPRLAGTTAGPVDGLQRQHLNAVVHDIKWTRRAFLIDLLPMYIHTYKHTGTTYYRSDVYLPFPRLFNTLLQHASPCSYGMYLRLYASISYVNRRRYIGRRTALKYHRGSRLPHMHSGAAIGNQHVLHVTQTLARCIAEQPEQECNCRSICRRILLQPSLQLIVSTIPRGRPSIDDA